MSNDSNSVGDQSQYSSSQVKLFLLAVERTIEKINEGVR